MNMLVCVKQVPDTTEIRIDPVKNTLIRDGVPSILNPFDSYALEAALRVKDQYPQARLTALCMGPPQAAAVLKESLAVGADRAYLVSGRTYGGSDTLATSYILSEAVREIEKTEGKFDIIFCGKQAIDGDTAQVGPEIGEHLGYAQVTYGLEVLLEADMVKVKKEVEEGVEVIGVKTPCVLTFTKPAWDLRRPTLKGKLAAARAGITVIGDDGLPDIDKAKIGLKGSPTKVKKTFVPPRKSGGLKIREASNRESAEKLFQLLMKDRTIWEGDV
ncbi:MAG: electron transfer flavoprotein subunit beta/FixA family protein [Enterocloster asparagiformis]|nr:electron transfer flavoprotein subunit beta/FixA family protein [Enterocloster asparagiformis]